MFYYNAINVKMCDSEELLYVKPESDTKLPIFKELNWKIMGDVDEFTFSRIKNPVNLN